METSTMASGVPADPPSSEAVEPPDISAIVTEDDMPVDNLYSEKQQRLLVDTLYVDWAPNPGEGAVPRPFLASSNVGLFPAVHETPLVPDVFVSLDVQPRQNLWEKRNRTYFFWEFGKPPEVVVEVVSGRRGGELGDKKRRYARMRIAHYVVWDPGLHLDETDLHAFELRGDLYVPIDAAMLPSIGLGVQRWHGAFERIEDTWLRWVRPDGSLVRTGLERVEAERERADAERERADAERERLVAKLRALGVDPTSG